MDLYQMIAAHSRPWSEREFLFFGSVILVCTLCLLAAVAMHKIKKTQALGAIIALVYMVIIFGSTVFTRGVSSRQCELTVLWSWKEVLAARDREMMTEILLNCVMASCFPWQRDAGYIQPWLFWQGWFCQGRLR